MLVYAIVSITLARVFYTVGVWSELVQGELKKWHLFMFWFGFIFDTIGTMMMGAIAQNGFSISLHGITGLLAIFLMYVHAVWATLVFIRNNKDRKKKFHKLSIFVWIVWLIPYASGAFLGISL